MKSLTLLLLSILFLTTVSAVIINEVEMNPAGTDARNEWIELFSKDEINLNEYKIINNDGDEIELNGSFQGYYIYIFYSQWLDNVNETVFLYKSVELIDKTEIFEDEDNNNKTWQFCDGEWVFLEETKNSENDCPEESTEEQQNTSGIEEEETIEEETPEIAGETSVNVEQTSSQRNIELKGIELTPQAIKTDTDSQVSDSGKRNYAVYGLIAFTVLLALLFLMKNLAKRNREKNEFE